MGTIEVRLVHQTVGGPAASAAVPSVEASTKTPRTLATTAACADVTAECTVVPRLQLLPAPLLADIAGWLSLPAALAAASSCTTLRAAVVGFLTFQPQKAARIPSDARVHALSRAAHHTLYYGLGGQHMQRLVGHLSDYVEGSEASAVSDEGMADTARRFGVAQDTANAVWAMSVMQAKLAGAPDEVEEVYLVSHLMSFSEKAASRAQIRRISAAQWSALPAEIQLYHLLVKAVMPREAHHSIMDPETLVEWEPIPGHTPPLARVVIDWYGEPLPSQDVLTMKLEVDEDGNLTGGVGVVMGSSDEEDYSDDSSDDIFNNSSDDRTAHAHGDDSSGG